MKLAPDEHSQEVDSQVVEQFDARTIAASSVIEIGIDREHSIDVHKIDY